MGPVIRVTSLTDSEDYGERLRAHRGFGGRMVLTFVFTTSMLVVKSISELVLEAAWIG